MTNIRKHFVKLALGAAVFVGSYTWNGPSGAISTSFVAPAEARVGRPLTPVSYAGVARRTTRRTVAVGAAAATRPVVVAAPTTVVVAPTTQTCVDTVNPNGTISRICQ